MMHLCIMMKRTDLLRQLYEANINEIKAIEQLSIDYDMLDNGYYLAWHDELNKLSLDTDRKSSVG